MTNDPLCAFVKPALANALVQSYAALLSLCKYHVYFIRNEPDQENVLLIFFDGKKSTKRHTLLTILNLGEMKHDKFKSKNMCS